MYYLNIIRLHDLEIYSVIQKTKSTTVFLILFIEKYIFDLLDYLCEK